MRSFCRRLGLKAVNYVKPSGRLDDEIDEAMLRGRWPGARHGTVAQ
jgi:hypothetical protein